MNLFSAVKHISLASLFCLTLGLPSVFAAPDTRDAASQNTLSVEDLNKESSELPKDDIQRFVTAIALIHHYYINPVTNTSLFDNSIRGMIASLDPHSAYLDAEDLKELKSTVSGEFVGVGIELTVSKEGLLKVISPLDGSPAQKAGIKPNDAIIKINKELVRNMSLEEAVRKIKGKAGTTVTLTILRQGVQKPLIFTLERQTIHLISVSSKMIEPGYAYVRITFFQGPLEKQLQEAIEKLKTQAGGRLKGFVLDLRNNPGGLLDVSAQVAGSFLDPNKLHQYHDYVVYTKGRIPGADIQLKAEEHDMIPGTPMVLLINGGSASASEIVAGALQDYKRAIIMGTRSFGKGSVQTVLPLSKDSALKLTTALYYTPAGREIQAEGIIPDVVVPELAVTPSKNDYITIDEAGFQNHLANANKDKAAVAKTAEEQKKITDTEVDLAKTDYQLYQAIMMLKGLNASGR